MKHVEAIKCDFIGRQNGFELSWKRGLAQEPSFNTKIDCLESCIIIINNIV